MSLSLHHHKVPEDTFSPRQSALCTLTHHSYDTTSETLSLMPSRESETGRVQSRAFKFVQLTL